MLSLFGQVTYFLSVSSPDALKRLPDNLLKQMFCILLLERPDDWKALLPYFAREATHFTVGSDIDMTHWKKLKTVSVLFKRHTTLRLPSEIEELYVSDGFRLLLSPQISLKRIVIVGSRFPFARLPQAQELLLDPMRHPSQPMSYLYLIGNPIPDIITQLMPETHPYILGQLMNMGYAYRGKVDYEPPNNYSPVYGVDWSNQIQKSQERTTCVHLMEKFEITPEKPLVPCPAIECENDYFAILEDFLKHIMRLPYDDWDRANDVKNLVNWLKNLWRCRNKVSSRKMLDIPDLVTEEAQRCKLRIASVKKVYVVFDEEDLLLITDYLRK